MEELIVDPLQSPTRATRWDERLRVAGLCLVLVAITIAVFGQTLTHEFVDFDDNTYVHDNPVVAKGLTLKGFAWAFARPHIYNWHPLTWLSHMLDCQLYGLHPRGHHLTNILLHSATAIALFLVLRQLTGVLWRSAFVAAVFAIHPLRVESVAWVAERKDVLSGLFFMLTIGAYVRYARNPWSLGRYGLVIVLFALGLMCKPMLVTLPLVLLLLDYWPLRRLEPLKLSGLVMEKIPLLALSAAVCVVTLVAQTGVIQQSGSNSLPSRLGNALLACMVYLRQMIYPSGLATSYPYPRNGLPTSEMVLAATLLACLSALAFWQRRRRPWLLMGWVWYLVMLLPVLGIIQVGLQAHADRYTYLPQIGIYVAATWLMAEWRANRAVLGGLMTGALAALMVCAWKQTTYWRNTETLWTHALACTTDNEVAHYGMGNIFLQKERLDDAITEYQEALKIKPDYVKAQVSLGNAILQKGNVDEAIASYQSALQIRPDFVAARCNLGNALRQKGKVDEAISQYKEALQINPDYAQGHFNLGIALLQKGQVDAAISHFQNALHIDPDNEDAHVNLGDIFLKRGSVDEAITHYKSALQIRPDYAQAHNNLGNALLQKGRVDEAITHFQMALQSNPGDGRIHSNLGNALLQKGKVPEAISHFQKALQLEPANLGVQNNLAWLLATCPEASLRNGNKAVELAQQANAMTAGGNPIVLRTLSAAFAEAGRFNDAKESAKKAIQLAQTAGQKDLAEQIKGELKRYETGLPIHQ